MVRVAAPRHHYDLGPLRKSSQTYRALAVFGEGSLFDDLFFIFCLAGCVDLFICRRLKQSHDFPLSFLILLALDQVLIVLHLAHTSEDRLPSKIYSVPPLPTHSTSVPFDSCPCGSCE